MASFGFALSEMQRGHAVTRSSWPRELQMRIKIMQPGPDSEMTMPYFYIEFGAGDKYVWFPSMDEMQAEDWSSLAIKKSHLILPGSAVS